MSLGTTVRTVVEFVSIPPRHTLRPSAPPSSPSPEKSPRLQIKLETVITGILTTLRPFPEAYNALREYFRRTPELEIVE